MTICDRCVSRDQNGRGVTIKFSAPVEFGFHEIQMDLCFFCAEKLKKELPRALHNWLRCHNHGNSFVLTVAEPPPA